jgi:hypothetical protein
MKAMEGF